MSPQSNAPEIALFGASGFVGSHLKEALEAFGASLRCLSRSPQDSSDESASTRWLVADVETGEGLHEALRGCKTAVYLVHGMASGEDYAERERESAVRFAAAAADEGLEHIIYLGGVAPAGVPSEHLRSRLETGEQLRESPTPTTEIRASMIIGDGSESWTVVRDLARRLPVMTLPTWMKFRSNPVFIDDLVHAIARVILDDTPDSHRILEAPGTKVLSHRDLVQAVAKECDKHPWMIDVPLITPKLSSLWIGLVTDADPDVAEELVQGLNSDLLPQGREIWECYPGLFRTGFEVAVRTVLADEKARRAAGLEPPAPAALARIRERVQNDLNVEI